MTDFSYNFDPVDRITVGTVGVPGQRTFYLQVHAASEQVAFEIEKEQVGGLAAALEEWIELIAQRNPLHLTSEDAIAFGQMELLEPLQPVVRVRQLGLGYDESQDRFVLLIEELWSDDQAEQRVSRLTFSRDQGRALAQRSLEVMAQGRPRCGQCGEPIDATGHFCPKKNGHRLSE